MNPALSLITPSALAPRALHAALDNGDLPRRVRGQVDASAAAKDAGGRLVSVFV